jgi:hypothetical protein
MERRVYKNPPVEPVWDTETSPYPLSHLFKNKVGK